MYRTLGLSMAAMAAVGISLAMTPSASAFHGGSNGSHGGSFGRLFNHHHGSSGSYGSHGGSSNSCACDCNDSDEGYENHNDGDDEVRDHASYQNEGRSM